MPDQDNQSGTESVWLPNQSERGFEVFNCYKRAVLIEGPRKSGKSIAICHKVWRHLWETPGARVGVFAKTIKSAKDGGSWVDLTEVVGPEWINSGMVGITGMPIEYTTNNGAGVPGPKQDGATRTLYFRIRNMHGGESELLLFSLDNDHEVEQKVKNLRFSLIWFVELSNFKTRKVFDISLLAVRMVHLNYDLQQWISDTNPAIEGKDSWIYKLWHEERLQEEHPKPGWQKGLHVIQFNLDDNPFLDPREREELEGTYANDPGEYDRNVLGIWTRGKGGIEKHFADLIVPEVHYVEDAIDVDPITRELIGGWDPGQVNHAFVIMEERLINGLPHYLILDELEIVGEQVSIEEFAYDCYQKMLALESFYKRDFIWEHWSDSTALDTYRSAIDGYDASIILKATQGRVELMGADKPDGSVGHSIKIIKKLLRERRLFIGKNCPRVINMLEELEQPNGEDETTVDKHHSLKHIFDAVRYPIYMRIRGDLAFGTPKSSNRSRLISVG